MLDPKAAFKHGGSRDRVVNSRRKQHRTSSPGQENDRTVFFSMTTASTTTWRPKPAHPPRSNKRTYSLVDVFLNDNKHQTSYSRKGNNQLAAQSTTHFGAKQDNSQFAPQSTTHGGKQNNNQLAPQSTAHGGQTISERYIFYIVPKFTSMSYTSTTLPSSTRRSPKQTKTPFRVLSRDERTFFN